MVALACAPSPAGTDLSGGAAQTGGSDDTAAHGSDASDSAGPADADASSGGGEGDTLLLDVGAADGGDGPRPRCEIDDGEIDAMGPCGIEAPPDSFDPVVQWSWDGVDGEDQVSVTPLVANLTDDNGDGAIDACDVPDVVVVAYAGDPALDDYCDLPELATVPPHCFAIHGHIHVLDGATGALLLSIAHPVSAATTPAIGDIDGDGLPEIVTIEHDSQTLHDAHLVAFEHDGALAWESTDVHDNSYAPISLADLDADGDVEIVRTTIVADHLGNRVATLGGGLPYLVLYSFGMPAIADLDGDDDLEIATASAAWHHDGTAYADFGAGAQAIAHQIADLDGDGMPEIIGAGWSDSYGQLVAFRHDGSAFASGTAALAKNPAAIHDVDGDGAPDVLVGGASSFSSLSGALQPNWTNATQDLTGLSSSTAFDFLGDGVAEAIYADETQLFVFDGLTGAAVLTWPRTSWTGIEYPVVADVDNDGSAEIVVVSNKGYYDGPSSPAVQVIRDAEDRWVPARRIWNQHAYHVTNVREDSTIPQVEPKNWLSLNTYRTQAQIEPGGSVCQPKPEG
jgi:FG-GAP-like repeat